MTQLLSSTEVCRRTGLSFRRLDYWVRGGVLHPPITANGSGSQRRWRPDQLPVIRAAMRLSDLGAEGEALGRVAGWLEHLPLGLWEGLLYVDGDGLVLLEPHEADAAYVVNLSACLVDEVQTALAV